MRIKKELPVGPLRQDRQFFFGKEGMKQLVSITDDLTGAADSGSYFTNRGIELTIYTELDPDKIILSSDHNMCVNLSTRNADAQTAFDRHYRMFRQIGCNSARIIMKKIGTGFRGQDPYELNGILSANEELVCFIVDSAPDLGTFTLYGNQYCEGCLLEKSLYTKDPVMPPSQSFIPDILKKGIQYRIECIDIDIVKGTQMELIERVAGAVGQGNRVIVFDAITKEDGKRIVSSLAPLYHNAVWTGSLGIADALSWYMSGQDYYEQTAYYENIIEQIKGERSAGKRCACFTASAYDATKRQIEYSMRLGLQKVTIDIDRVLDGDQMLIDKAVNEYLENLEHGNTILVPKVERYSCKKGVSSKILSIITECADGICKNAMFDRLVIIGGETSQSIMKQLDMHVISLKRSGEIGTAEGIITEGGYRGKWIALKGGSIGSEQALERMMGK